MLRRACGPPLHPPTGQGPPAPLASACPAAHRTGWSRPCHHQGHQEPGGRPGWGNWPLKTPPASPPTPASGWEFIEGRPQLPATFSPPRPQVPGVDDHQAGSRTSGRAKQGQNHGELGVPSSPVSTRAGLGDQQAHRPSGTATNHACVVDDVGQDACSIRAYWALKAARTRLLKAVPPPRVE